MQDRFAQREYWSGKVGDDWAAHADRIDAMFGPLTAAALDIAAYQTGESVLDIGCGAGATSLEIGRRVGATGSVVGVDVSPPLLNAARARAGQLNPNVSFVEADAGAADLGKRFDAVFSRFGIMFFETPTDAFAHIRAQMREQGRLTFICWRALAENVWTTASLEAIAPMLKAPLTPPDPDAPGPFAFAREEKVKRILNDSGWRDVVVSRWDGPVSIGGGGDPDEIAGFVMKIGPCARAIADQNLDAEEAKHRLIARLSPFYKNGGVELPAACWLVTANAWTRLSPSADR